MQARADTLGYMVETKDYILREYQVAEQYLFSQLPMYQRIGKTAYKVDIARTRQLNAYFNCPHKKYPVVHVGGTNGKGSVCHILAAILQQAGYKVGLHTSPHLLDFRERAKINGKLMDKQFVINFITKHKVFIDSFSPSFFEISVFMAFEYFAQQQVDIAIIEVGLGGRLDTTNVVAPILSVITNISYEHQAFLGTTLEKIAMEKAGIIKAKVPVVIGEYQKDTEQVFVKVAGEKKSELVVADNTFTIRKKNEFQNKFNIYKSDRIVLDNFEFSLGGAYQIKNLITAFAALDLLRKEFVKINNFHIKKALKDISYLSDFHGRWEIIRKKPLTICDVAHNREGLKYVAAQIKQITARRKYIILGFVEGKDLDSILEIMPKDAIYYISNSSVPRSEKCEKVLKLANNKHLKAEGFLSVKRAVEELEKKVNISDLVVITGSTFMVADYLKYIKNSQI